MTAYARSYLAHTGAILFNFSMIGFFLSLSAFFGVILVVLFTVLLVMLLIGSLGLVLLLVPNYLGYITGSGELLEKFAPFFAYTPQVALVSLILAAVSVPLMNFDARNPKILWRLICASFLILVLAIALGAGIYTGVRG